MKKTKITDYQPDPANPNRHTERGVKMLKDSLSKVGLGRSIVVDKNGYIIAGNSTQERAVDQGFEDAIEIEADGNQMIVVKRTDLDLLSDDQRARLLSYFDNRAGETGLEWNIEQLLADQQAGFNFDGLFYDWELDQFKLEPDDFDPNKEWQGMPEFEQDGIKPFHSLRLHFKTEDDMRAFAELVGQTVTDKTTYLYYPKQEKQKVLDTRIVIDES